MRNWIDLITEAVMQRVSIEQLPYETKQDIIVMLLDNCPPFEEYWMKHEGIMSFNETYVSQFIFGYEIDYHPEGDGAGDENWFPVDILTLSPDEIDNTNRSVSNNVVAKYAALYTTPPMILVKREGSGWKIVEGGHRLAAAKLKGSKTIKAVDVTIFFNTDYEAL